MELRKRITGEDKLVINLSLEASQMVLVVKNPSAIAGKCKRCGFDPWIGKIPWKRKWQPTPIFLPEKSYGQRGLAGYSPWDHRELDTREQLTLPLPKSVISFEDRWKQKPHIYFLNFEFYHTSKILIEFL